MRKMKLFLMVLSALMTTAAFAQNITVTGNVTDASNGEPVPFASVHLQGTMTGVSTDAQGHYSLSVPADGILVFSSIGYKTIEVAVASRTQINVAMESDSQFLDETIVVAYGTATKSSFTGSAAMVKSDAIEAHVATNVTSALAGTTPGVQMISSSGDPASNGSSIRIRGIGSMSASSAPLYVVDGMPYDGSISDINPNDVESMSVLKDAAASAIYGARGANGVVLITTKRAQAADALVKFDAKWGSNSRLIPQYDVITNPAEYYETHYKMMYNSQIYAGKSVADAYAYADANIFDQNNGGLGYQVYTVPAGEKFIGTNFKLNPKATLGYSDGEYYYTPDDWYGETFHNSFRQEYNLSISGSKDRLSYYGSVGYLDDGGIVNNSGYKRYTARINADYQAKKWFKVTTDMNYTHFDRNYVDNEGDELSSGNMFSLQNIAPIYPVFYRDAQGNIMYHTESGIKAYDYGDITNLGLVRPYLNQANPISDLLVNTSNSDGNTFRGVGTFDIYFPYGFTFTSTNSTYVYESRGTSVTNPYFGQYKSSKGVVGKSHSRQWDVSFAQRLNWHQTYGKNDIEVMLGHEFFRNRNYALSGSKSNMSSQGNKELDGAVVMQSTSSSLTEYNTESWMARGMYNYDDRYFAYGSIMRQGSSAFHPDHRWGTFWSTSAGWMLSKEKWFDAKWVDELKVKASYGENGNDLGMRYSYYYTNRYTIVNSNNNIAMTPSSTKGNEKLTWEKNAKFNVGVDFSFFKGRLTGTMEYYNNRTEDMLASFPYPPTLGYTSALFNVGNMSNQGFEMELRGDVIRTKDFTWNLYANLTTNKNKITKLAKERKTQEYDGYWGYTNGSYYLTEGLSRYTYWSKKYAGVYNEKNYALTGDEAYNPAKGGLALYYKNVYATDEQGNVLKDKNNAKVVDKVIATTNHSEADYYVGDDMLAKAFGGFGTGFQFKGFDLGVDFQYQIGGKVYDGEYQTLMSGMAGYGFHKDILNAWTPENSGSNIPRLQESYSAMASSSDRWLTDASYLTLGNITLGYTLDKQLMNWKQIQSIRLYAVADNIYPGSKRRGLDPRQSLTGGSSGQMYSPIRSVSFGVNVVF